jgi:hypothetical protein
MACIRKRRSVWVLDYRDTTGMRRTPSFRTRAEAEDHADRVGAFARHGRRVPTVDPQITVASYATRWLGQLTPLLKPAAYAAHAVAVAHYVTPRLGRCRVVDLSRAEVINFLTGCRERGVSRRPLAPGSVRVIYSALRAMLTPAVDEQLVVGNVAARLGRKFSGRRSMSTRASRLRSIRTVARSARSRARGWRCSTAGMSAAASGRRSGSNRRSRSRQVRASGRKNK